MKARVGKTYAQILAGHCHWLFTAADLPEWSDADVQVVDVTGQAVQVGDAWDGARFVPQQPSPAHKWDGDKWVLDAALQAAQDAQTRKAQAGRIDDAVAAIYARFDRYALEYQVREAQAQAFKDGGYQGAPQQQVAAFATPAGKEAKEATDTILAQAAAMRDALGKLGVLRMRKYEVLAATSAAAAQAKADAVLAAVAQVAAQL